MTRCQAADIINIDCVIAIAESDLGRIRRYIEKRLDAHRGIADVAAVIVDELNNTQATLERAAADCRCLADADRNRDQLSLQL